MSATEDRDTVVAAMVAQLGRAWTMRELAAAAGLSRGRTETAVQALRWTGKIAFETLTLSPSMIPDAGSERQEEDVPAREEVAPPPAPREQAARAPSREKIALPAVDDRSIASAAADRAPGPHGAGTQAPEIGDTLAWPEGEPFNADAIRIAMNNRGIATKMARRRATNQQVKSARRQVALNDEAQARLSDPFEQARLFLGRRGIPVFSAAVYEEDFGEATAKRLIAASDWVVGGERYPDRAAVMDRARADGWQGPHVSEQAA